MEFQLIPDEVLELTNENDLLGTKPYSNTLFEIVKKSEGKKNIGLFGSWGSGKSTILKTLESKISKHNKDKEKSKIGFFEFDAWKYSKDDFRRSFIVELNKKFDIIQDAELTRRLYNDTNIESPELTKTKFSKLSLSNWMVVALVIGTFIFYFSPILEDEESIKSIISLFVLTISVFNTALNNTFVRYKVSVKHNKIIEPEIFEEIFKDTIHVLTTEKELPSYVPKWVKHFITKPKFQKIVIVIDNLDRCDNENLLVTLNTIKNFLESENVIFILPVDEKGVFSFLSKSTDNAGEYLRKVFHIIIRLKVSSKKELQEFTKKLNEKYQLNLSLQSIRLICQEFTSNPRKVIQFLNNYQSEMRLIEEQSDLGYIDGSYIKENISFFIKLLIIKSEWRGLYDEILYDKTLLNKINDVITNIEPDENDNYLIVKSKVKLKDTQRKFFFSTQSIHCSKIDPFILNIDLEKEIPDEIAEFITFSNYKGIIDYLNNNNEFTEKHLLEKIDDLYSELNYKHRDYDFIALPILVLLLKFTIDKNQIKFQEELKTNYKKYSSLKNLFSNPRIRNLFEKLNFEDLSISVKWFLENIDDDFYNVYIDYLNITVFNHKTTRDDENEKMKIFFKIFDNKRAISSVKNEYNKKIIEKPTLTNLNVIDDSSKILTKETYSKLSTYLLKDSSKTISDSVKIKISNLSVNYLKENIDEKLTKNVLLYNIGALSDFHSTEGGISEDTFVNFEEYFIKIASILNSNIKYKLEGSFKEILTSINKFLLSFYITSFNYKEHFKLYSSFFTFIKNLIFYTKDFNLVSYRELYFHNYLKSDVSEKMNLIINDILYEDVNNYSAYMYPFTPTLINYYNNNSKSNFNYARTLLLMIQKGDSKNSLSDTEIKPIIKRTLNVFSFWSRDKRGIENMKFLKKHAKELLLEEINSEGFKYQKQYISRVKQLNDKWFYDDFVVNFLNRSLTNDGKFNSFLGKLRLINKVFTTKEQAEFIDLLFRINDSKKIYSWFKTTHNILSRSAFDIYLANLIYAHSEKIVGHNDFFEWITKIPKTSFYKKRLEEYIKYIKALNITHKTYKYKKENALKYLS